MDEKYRELWISTDHILELKIDGQSGYIVIDGAGRVRCFRKTTEVTRHLPGVEDPYLAWSVFHVEWAAGRPAKASDVSTFLSRGGYKRVVEPRVHLLDVLWYKGRDLRERPLRYRLGYRAEAVSWLQNAPGWSEIGVWGVDWDWNHEGGSVHLIELAKLWIDAGHEGAVLKHWSSEYEHGRINQWYKWKPMRTMDCAVLGYAPGGGRLTGVAGALKLFLLADDMTWRLIGQCSGMTDAVRAELTERLDREDWFVAEVSYQNWTGEPGYSRLRHPQFKRLRPDKMLGDCVLADQVVAS